MSGHSDILATECAPRAAPRSRTSPRATNKEGCRGLLLAEGAHGVVRWAARRWVGKVAAMSTAAGADHVLAQPVLPGSSPQAIRAALLPEEVGNFDREYRREMAAAIETLDLTPVIEMLARWQLVVRSSQDPQAHRRMLAHAAILNAGGDIPRTSWEETKARLGL